MIDSRRQLLKSVKDRKYLNRDFDGFRADLKNHGAQFFPDVNKDFSENSLGGLFLEMNAYVGDVMSYYQDHLFHELNPETAVEPKNIERHLRASNVEIVGAASAVVTGTFYIKVPIRPGSSPPEILTSALPVIQAGTTLISDGGVVFELIETLDFRELNDNGYKAGVTIGSVDANGMPTSFVMTLDGICVSGLRAYETFDIGSFEAFKKVTLSKENVTEIISVTDDVGNVYYEVENLTQDTVFQSVVNRGADRQLVKEALVITPAPYRFTKQMSISSRLTSLTFGGGNAQTLNDDIVPDPSEFALPLYGKTSFSRFAINPGNLLQTSTLGVIAPNTTLTVVYRYGGGLSHNIPPKSIRGVGTLNMSFPNSPTSSVAAFVRDSTDATNLKEGGGGDDPPTLDDLKMLIGSAKNAQGRIVSNPDLISRIYRMPSNFGRAFRVATRENPNNPLATRIYVISRNQNGELAIAPDLLKKNIAKYLNEFRLISDAYDILDVAVVNLQLEFTIVADPDSNNKQQILQGVLVKLADYFNIKKFEIDQALSLEHVRNIIFNNQGVVSVQNLQFRNITGTAGTRTYSDVQFDVSSNTYKGLLIGPPGSMFEIKYKEHDLIGTVV